MAEKRMITKQGVIDLIDAALVDAGNLPTPGDEGDALQVIDGDWTSAPLPEPPEPGDTLPEEGDNGEVLTVVGGEWASAPLPPAPPSTSPGSPFEVWALWASPVLASLTPASGWESLYVVPASTVTEISALHVVNVGASATFGLAVVPDGEVLGSEHEVFSDYPLGAASDLHGPVAITLEEGDEIFVESSSGDVTISIQGKEEA